MRENLAGAGDDAGSGCPGSSVDRDTGNGPLPGCVAGVLAKWDGLSLFAYEGFAGEGRGAVVIDPRQADAGILFVWREFFAERNDGAVLAILDAYDPDWEIVLYFEDGPGIARTIRVRTAPGSRHPKRVYFFEMLRRLNEGPETLPDRLPDWFHKACADLQGAMRRASRAKRRSRRKGRPAGQPKSSGQKRGL